MPGGESRVEAVVSDCEAARAHLRTAFRFLDDGRSPLLSPESRYALLYDGTLNALLGVLASAGRRVTQGVGHHARTIAEAGRLLGPDATAPVRRAESARRVRNRVQCHTQAVSEGQVTVLSQAADQLLELAGGYVAARCPDGAA